MSDYKAPQTIVEARKRMLDGEIFCWAHYEKIWYESALDKFLCHGNEITQELRTIPSTFKKWLSYKGLQPEFPFQFDELVCARISSCDPWIACRYGMIENHLIFVAIGGNYFEEITAFKHDLLGKVCEPDTPVWIVRDGKPCQKK